MVRASERSGRDRPVVVGVDGSSASLRAAEWAAGEARCRHLRLRLVHVNFWTDAALSTPGFEDEARRQSLVLEQAAARVRASHPDVEVECRSLEPPTGAALVRESADATLLVVGSRGLGAVRGLVLGSVSRECVQHARCSVLVVRGDRRDAPGEGDDDG
ncbi:MAG: universal stress protein [Acidimicrobiales bacterium]